MPIDLVLQRLLNENTYNFIVTKGVIVYLWITLFSFFFSISYTVALLGTCINFFFANLYMDKSTEQIKNENNNNIYTTYIVQIKKDQQ